MGQPTPPLERRRLVWLLVLLGAVCFVPLLRRSDSDSTPARSLAAPRVNAASLPSEPASEPLLPETPQAAKTTRRTASLDASRQTLSETAPRALATSTAFRGEGLPVRVRYDGKPVAQATVYYSRRRPIGHRQDPRAWRECDAVTAAHGEAWVPPGMHHIAAESGERFGVASLSFGHGPTTIDLEPVRVVRARVLNHLGHPVEGVSVELTALRARAGETTSPDSDETQRFPVFVDRNVSDEDGRALFFNPPTLVGDAAVVGMRLRAGVQSETPVETEFASAVFGGEHTLRLPPLSEVLVELREIDGSPFPFPAQVWVVAEGVRSRASRIHGGELLMWSDPGRSLRISAKADDAFGGDAGETLVEDPLGPGERRRVVVTLDGKGLVFRGRLPERLLQVETGTRLMDDALELVRVNVRAEGLSAYWRRVEALPDGLVRWREEANSPLLGKALDVRPDGSSLDRNDVPRARGTVPLGASGGFVELGDLELVPFPVVVAGVRVDTKGEVFPARFELRRRSLVEENSWNHVDSSNGPTFRFEGYHDPQREYAVRVTASGLSRQYPVEFGDEHLELLLERPGGVAGRFLLGPEVTAKRLAIEIRPSTASAEQGESPGGLSGRRGARSEALYGFNGLRSSRIRLGQDDFTADVLAPGEYDVFVMLSGSESILHRIDGVQVPPGAKADDPRLEAIDLRHVRTIRLRVVDANGRSVVGGDIFRTDAPSGARLDEPVHLATIHQSEVQLLLADLSFDLELRIPGHRVKHLRRVDGDRRVVLDAGLAVRLTLPAGIPDPPPPLELRVTLDRAGKGSRSLPREEHAITAGAVVLHVPVEGTYEPSLWLTDLDRRTSSPLRILSAETFEIREEGQSFEIRPDSTQIETALERILNTRAKQERETEALRRMKLDRGGGQNR